MDERRRSTRQRSFFKGCIYFNNRLIAADCLVRDISAIGARLILSEAVSVPDVVEIHIAQKKRTLPARMQWRHGSEAGVIFTKGRHGPDWAAALDPEVADRVDKLEFEVTFLRDMLKRVGEPEATKQPRHMAALSREPVFPPH